MGGRGGRVRYARRLVVEEELRVIHLTLLIVYPLCPLL
jgi:hypothetical protein